MCARRVCADRLQGPRSRYCEWRGRWRGRAWRSEWDVETCRCCQALLVGVEGEEIGCTHDPGSGDVEDIKSAVAAGQGVGGGKAGRFGKDICEVADMLYQSAIGEIGIKQGRENPGISRAY